MSEIDFFGHFGYFFLLMGMIYVGAKEPAGWFMRLFGEMIWICLGFVLGLTSIWMWGLVFVAVDLYNFQKWQAEQKFVTDFWHDVDEMERVNNRREMKIMDGTIKFSKFGVQYDVEDFEYGAYLDHVTNGETQGH